MRTLISCVKQKATPNLNEAKADTIVARPSLQKMVFFDFMFIIYLNSRIDINACYIISKGFWHMFQSSWKILQLRLY